MNTLFKAVNITLPKVILQEKIAGNLDESIRLIDEYLINEKDNNIKNSLLIQKEIIKRLPFEYSISYLEGYNSLKSYVNDLTLEEFDHLLATNKIDWIYINHQKYLFNRFLSVLFKNEDNIIARVTNKHPIITQNEKNSYEDNLLNDVIAKMIKNKHYLNHFTISCTLKLQDDHFSKDHYLIHLPIPCHDKYQHNITINKIYPDNGIINDGLQATLCFDNKMENNHEYMVEYSYDIDIPYFDMEKALSSKEHLKYEQKDFDTDEQLPHIIFTPLLKQTVDQLSANINDPLLKAKAFYDYITLNMHYRFMPSYIILDNIIDNILINKSGDCGIFALLFITMCRYSKIPCRWQSGYTSYQGFCSGHDWVQIYIEPYGWIYVDPSYGVDAHHLNNEWRRRFYFGNIDPYRTIINNDFYKEFVHPKKYLRADPYDNQCGEIENTHQGFQFGEFSSIRKVIKCEGEEK